MENYQQICQSCMNKYVGIQTTDGVMHDGFIAHVDNEYVTLAIPTTEMMNRFSGMPSDAGFRQFGYGFPRRRFMQRRIPYPLIASLFLLPFFF